MSLMHKYPNFTELPLEKRVRSYLQELFLFCRSEFRSDLRSLVLFGSQTRSSASNISDVDIIIIVSDSVSKRRICKSRGKIEWLEIKYSYSLEVKGILRFFRALDRATGMFVSHFICHETEFISGNFARIFGVNRLLAFLTAPGESVLFNMQHHAITLWGDNLLVKMRTPKLTTAQLMKSLIMNLLLTTGTLLLAPLTNESTRRSLESQKWSVHTTLAWLLNKSLPLDQGIQILTPQPCFLRSYLRILLYLRKNYQPFPKLILLSPFLIFLIHRKGIKQAHSLPNLRDF
ncbi:MAG: nucleotidyltransferase domain-containing protein [Promethearchaeota archaeon]